MQLRKREGGFTLAELLIALVIFSLLVSMSAPGFSNLVSNHRLNQATDSIGRAIYLARTEAIIRGQRVVLCLSNAGSQCNGGPATQLLLFADGDLTGTPSAPSDIIQQLPIPQEGISISYNRPYLRFTPLGHAAGTNGTFTFCKPDKQGAMLIISTLGRMRKAIDYDGDGLVEKTAGNPIQC